MADHDETPPPPQHLRGMRAYLFQIIAGAVALACFVAAIVTVDAVLVSAALLLGGVVALLALAVSLIQRVNAWGALQRMRERRRNRAV